MYLWIVSTGKLKNFSSCSQSVTLARPTLDNSRYVITYMTYIVHSNIDRDERRALIESTLVYMYTSTNLFQFQLFGYILQIVFIRSKCV